MKLNFGPPTKTGTNSLDIWVSNVHNLLTRLDELVSSGGLINHESLEGLLGGASSDHYHLTLATTADLTDSGSTTLHKHNHALMDNLAYADAAHTGFQASLGYTAENTANKETGSTLTDSTTKYPSSHTVATAIAAAGGGDWNTDSTNTWSYSTASQIKITGVDLTALLPVGCKICITQTTPKYFYSLGATLSGSDTLLNVSGGSDFTVANAAITLPKYSYASSPTGFPHWFNHAETWAGFSSDPSDGSCKFKIEGRLATMRVWRNSAGTSDAAETTISLPVTSATTTSDYISVSFGGAYNGSWQPTPGVALILSNSGIAYLLLTLAAQFAASGAKNWAGTITWEI